MYPKLFLTFIYLCTIQICKGQDNPIVETPYGKVRGTLSYSYNGKQFAQFYSIPYAKPPVGELRFEEPQPLTKWDGIWEANFTVECAQIGHVATSGGNFFGQEDCLYVNVFVPTTNPSEAMLLDVIVDIHGGGFNFGSSVFYSGPEYIMDKNVVFVTLNYRVGFLGFLSTEDDVVPGNNGMKDQVAALKWVKNNIQYFGGNPNSITLTGLSAGGASVQYHYLSPLSKGLFKAGVSISGTALCPWTLQENALEKARSLGSAVGCSQKSTKDLIRCLKQRSVKQIEDSLRIFRPWLINPFSVVGLVVEKHNSNPFLPKHPYQLLMNGEVQDLPWITSTVSHEGLYPAADYILQDDYLPELEKRWEELAPHILHYEHTIPSELSSSISNKIKKYYLKGKPISIETYQEVIQIISDRLFMVDSEKAARLQAKANKSPTYYYYFTYEGEEVPSATVHFAYSETRHGISHGDDVGFILHNPHLPLKKMTKLDEDMKNVLLNIWSSLAKTGKPVIEGVNWPSVSKNMKEPFHFIHIKSPKEIVVEQAEELGNRSFWDSLPFEENEKLFLDIKKG